MFISLILPEFSRDNEISYAFRHDTAEVENGLTNETAVSVSFYKFLCSRVYSVAMFKYDIERTHHIND